MLSFILSLSLLQFFGCVSVSEEYCYMGSNRWQEGTVASPVFYEFSESEAIIVTATYWHFFAVNAKTGETLWLKDTYDDDGEGLNERFESGIVMVTDFYEEGDVVFIVGSGDAQVTIVDKDGNILRQTLVIPDYGRRVTSILAGKIDPEKSWTVVVGLPTTDLGRYPNTWWLDPYLNTQQGMGARPIEDSQEGANSLGVFGKNQGLYDLNGDGKLETIVPSDDFSVAIWDSECNQWGVDQTSFYNANNFWSNVIFSRNYTYEFRGWAGSQHDLKPFFAHGIATAVPVQGSDEPVIAVSGLYASDFNRAVDEYHSIFVLNPDRTRADNWKKSFDHCQPYYKDSNLAMIQMNIAYADLTGDGENELIFPCSDGKVYAVELMNDQNIIGDWPYDLGSTVSKPRYASEVVIFEIPSEDTYVAFTTWGPNDEFWKEGGYNGSLIVLNSQGQVVEDYKIPPPQLDDRYNGAYGLSLFRYEQDTSMGGNLYAAVQTSFSGLCVFELLDTENAVILWQTSRGNFQRTGGPPFDISTYPFVQPSSFTVESGTRYGSGGSSGADGFLITFGVMSSLGIVMAVVLVILCFLGIITFLALVGLVLVGVVGFVYVYNTFIANKSDDDAKSTELPSATQGKVKAKV